MADHAFATSAPPGIAVAGLEAYGGAVGSEGAWPLIGRDEEMALLAAEPTEAPSLVVAGPVGVGKSRLVADFLARAGAEGVATEFVRATRSTATIPFGPFAPWAVDGQGMAAADRLGVLRALSSSLVGGHEQLVMAVDDAHLLDDGSAALVLHLAANTSARVVVTVRTGELCPDAVTALWKEGLAARIDLQALSEAETAELAERALGGPVDQAARRRLWSLTEGVPLYLREVVRAALAQGVLAREGRHWHWRGALAGSDRLQGLMRDHLAQAGSDERRLLELLAVGEPLPWILIDRLGATGAVQEAEAHGFVAGDDPDRLGDGPTLRLAHPLYGELLRADVPAMAVRGHQAALAEAALVTGWHHQDPLRVAVWALDGGAPLDAPGLLTAAARRALHLSEWALAERLSTAAGSDPEAIITRALSLAPQARADEASVLLAGLAIEALNGEIDEAVAGEAARVHSWLVYWAPGTDPHRGRRGGRRRAPADAAAGSRPGALRLPVPPVGPPRRRLGPGRAGKRRRRPELAARCDGPVRHGLRPGGAGPDGRGHRRGRGRPAPGGSDPGGRPRAREPGGRNADRLLPRPGPRRPAGGGRGGRGAGARRHRRRGPGRARPGGHARRADGPVPGAPGRGPVPR